MKVHFGFDQEVKELGRTVASLGNYDGVHMGHQAVLKRAVEQARKCSVPSVAITFDPVPKKILYPQSAAPLLQTLQQRLHKMEALHLDHTIVVAFDQSFARKTPQEFVKEYLLGILRIQGFVVGRNFSFGHQKKGNVSLLQEMGREHDFWVEGIPEIQINGMRISSTLIRELVRNGKMEEAAMYLGSPFALIGKIVGGEQVGGKLGIPTANLDAENELLPGNGVYVTKAILSSRAYPSVTNVGIRPTFGGEKLTVEAHLLDETSNLYGQQMELEFLYKLREEIRFPNIEALKHQIQSDINAARAYFAR
ncbi:MAG TPA: bifunctional riboflavin kinase/FAD synthetase [Acidobacteriota bacterium]|nr:bifunctional riboflavin kinase/FAD synthetase [Acidobacteriota bacterium]